MSNTLASLLTDRPAPRILVVGDVMLDRYLWGDVERISPEAPIPLVRVGRREERLGGAGSVAVMLAALEAEVTLVSVAGDDREGRRVAELIYQAGLDPHFLLTDVGRCTTVKQRILGRTHGRHPQQMMRVDQEDARPVDERLAGELAELVAEIVPLVDLVLVSDYDKGLCAGEFVERLIRVTRRAGVPVAADPVRGVDFHRYGGCACLTPNRAEAGWATGVDIQTPEDGLEAARWILDFDVETAIVTLDRDGIAWADRQGGEGLLPVRQRQVYDITGAGDMVLSAIGYCLAAGADTATAVELANLAGGLEVERLGVEPITREQLLTELAHGRHSTGGKVLPLEVLLSELQDRRQRGQRIAMTNGCFDVLHPGHVASLQEARRHGDLLVVGLNSDRGVAELKGPGRPVIDQQGRAEMLAALACVDYVVMFDDASVEGLVERILPDVLVKAAQYDVDQVVGREIVQRHGGRVVLVSMKDSYSTSRLVRSIRELPSNQ